MKKKKPVKENKYCIHLVCQECGHHFLSDRYRKYCTYQCQRVVSKRLGRARYAAMREIVLKAKGVIK